MAERILPGRMNWVGGMRGAYIDFIRPKYNLIRPKGPCGTHFWPKIQFYLPKSPLLDDFLAQSTILSAQKAPAGRISNPKYNFIRPKGPCGTTFCYSQSEIYDIGTEILFSHCFATKIINSFYESIIPEDSGSSRRDLAFYSIKT